MNALSMSEEVVVTGRILKWGNSYGIRIKKGDLERAGLVPGADAVVKLSLTGKVDLSHIHFLAGGKRDDSERHDELVGEARAERLKKRFE